MYQQVDHDFSLINIKKLKIYRTILESYGK